MSRINKIPNRVVYVCVGSKCKKRGGKELSKEFRDMIKEAGLKETVEMIRTECTDRCKRAPVICVQPQNLWFYEVNPFQTTGIFNSHLLEPFNPEG